MSNFTMPDPEKVKLTSARVRQAIQDIEIAGLELQEVMDMFEQPYRQQRLARLKSTLNKTENSVGNG